MAQVQKVRNVVPLLATAPPIKPYSFDIVQHHQHSNMVSIDACVPLHAAVHFLDYLEKHCKA